MDAPNQNSDPLKTLQMIADSSSGQLRWSSNTLSSFLDAPIRNASLYKGLSVLPSVRWSVGLSVGRYVRYTALKTLFSALFCRGDENMKPNTIQYVLRASLATLDFHLSGSVCLSLHNCHMFGAKFNSRGDPVQTHRCPIGLIFLPASEGRLPKQQTCVYNRSSSIAIVDAHFMFLLLFLSQKAKQDQLDLTGFIVAFCNICKFDSYKLKTTTHIRFLLFIF